MVLLKAYCIQTACPIKIDPMVLSSYFFSLFDDGRLTRNLPIQSVHALHGG